MTLKRFFIPNLLMPAAIITAGYVIYVIYVMGNLISIVDMATWTNQASSTPATWTNQTKN